ncbi:hypothetical protein [Streptomyces sp. G-G2]|uniref:hypothetical protein n=1 Tax=Streptomyces sp. G-G2 TaxID=3046201 RepID=UPI0024BAAB35|nr:hypothetical protein [Streptomyces sp. G-G2]MDJ0382989.1 hypothetical protein [Streptomyces sp. G-G2]
MTRPAPSATRAARWSRAALLAVLLLGIVTMHTLGHPKGSHTGQDAPAAHSVAHGAATTAAAGMTGMSATAALTAEHRVAPDPRAPAAGPAAPVAGSGAPVARVPDGRMAMDPMAVCLAVLLAGITLLTVLALARTAAGPPAPLAARPGRAHGGPDPPSARELLTRLAVLRV